MAQQLNGKVSIPTGYFLRMAKADYTDYQTALAREFYQNSIDAGATVIEVTRRDDEITIKDNGCGMDRDVLVNKLLVLGGSHKAEGAVGAFGKAKELLFFSWKRYTIHTLNQFVVGSGADYVVSDAAGYVHGTTVTIKIQEDVSMAALMAGFQDVARRIEVPGVRIVVNGEEQRLERTRGIWVKDLGWAKLYHNKKVDNPNMAVRIGGIWMFNWYLGNRAKTGSVTLELSGSSVECLTSNRDGLQYKYRALAEKEAKSLINDFASTVRAIPRQVRRLIQGYGKVKAVAKDMVRAILAQDEPAISPTAELLMKMEQVGVNKVVAAKRLELLNANMEKDLETKVAEISFASYDPDFILKHNSNQTGRVNKFMGTNKASILADMWTETVKQVLIDCGQIGVEFTAGFTFDDTREAEYEARSGGISFLLNPFKVLNDLNLSHKALSDRKLLIEDLKAKACHEVTHHLVGSYHDEEFCLKMHWVMAQTWGSRDVYSTISYLGQTR